MTYMEIYLFNRTALIASGRTVVGERKTAVGDQVHRALILACCFSQNGHSTLEQDCSHSVLWLSIGPLKFGPPTFCKNYDPIHSSDKGTTTKTSRDIPRATYFTNGILEPEL